MYSVDPATFDAYKKNDKKNTEEKKNSKQVNVPEGGIEGITGLFKFVLILLEVAC